MSDATRALLRGAAPPCDEPPSLEVLWKEGRRRRRRAVRLRATAVIVVALVALVALGAAGVAARNGRGDAALSVGASVTGADAAHGTTGSPLAGAADAEVGPPPGFPVAMDVRAVRDGDPARVEVLLSPTTATAAPVTMVIPLTLQTWDTVTGRWTPTDDLYDQSRGAPELLQPHGTGPAWYERTSGEARGLPLQLPAELPAGVHRICIQVWPSSDDPAGTSRPPAADTIPVTPSPSDHRAFGRASDADSIDALPQPPGAVTLCRAVELSQPENGHVAG
jgi:hypothetical protein